MDYSKFKMKPASFFRKELDSKTFQNKELIEKTLRNNIINEIFKIIEENNKKDYNDLANISLFRNGEAVDIIPNKDYSIEVNDVNMNILQNLLEKLTTAYFSIYVNMRIEFHHDITIDNIIDEDLKTKLREYLLSKDIEIISKKLEGASKLNMSKIELSKGKRTYFKDIEKFLKENGYEVNIGEYHVTVKY